MAFDNCADRGETPDDGFVTTVSSCRGFCGIIVVNRRLLESSSLSWALYIVEAFETVNGLTPSTRALMIFPASGRQR